MIYEFTGTIDEICEMQNFPSGFSKRELIVREDRAGAAYPNAVTFNFKKENAAKLEGLKVGERVAVSFVLDGRSWTDPRTNKIRHFSDLVGLGVAAAAAKSMEPAASPAGMPAGASEERIPF